MNVTTAENADVLHARNCSYDDRVALLRISFAHFDYLRDHVHCAVIFADMTQTVLARCE